MKERNKAVPAVYLILEKNEKILIALRDHTGYQDGNWNLPSGHVEAGELPKEAMIREANEELGIVLRRNDLKFVHASYRPKHDETGDRVDFFFKAIRWGKEIFNAEPHKCAELLWVSPEDLPDNMTPHVRHIIYAVQEGVAFSELDVGWLKKNGVWMLD